jgi:hypothetical protein
MAAAFLQLLMSATPLGIFFVHYKKLASTCDSAECVGNNGPLSCIIWSNLSLCRPSKHFSTLPCAELALKHCTNASGYN